MSSFPVVGLMNIGNICFINSAFQCLASLKSMQTFLTTKFGDIAEEQIFLRMVQNELYQLAKPSQETTRLLSYDLLRYIYERILYDTFNTQQDVTDLLRGLFQVFKIWAPRTYANFQVTATTECYGSKRLDASWGLQLNVSESENSIDIGQLLSEAVFLQPGQVCTCGQNRIHIYGDLPQCLVITVIKLKFNKALQKGFVRQSVQIKCKPTYKIQGFEYVMKAAVEYIGADYIGGGSVCSGLKKITCCDNKKAKRRERLHRERVNTMRDNFALSRYSSQPTNVGMCPTPEEFEEETSFDNQLPNELATTSVEDETSFNEETSESSESSEDEELESSEEESFHEETPSSDEEDLESSLDESFNEASPNLEELVIKDDDDPSCKEDSSSSEEELESSEAESFHEAIPEELLPSFKAEYLAANELERQDESVAAEESFKDESSSEEDLESSQESLHDATPSQEELTIIQEFLAANESISCATSNETTFQSKPRNYKPLANPDAGHYMSYVKRDEGFYHISDKDVMKVKVIETDDLYVLFYERK